MSSLDGSEFIDVHYHVNPDAYMRRHSAATAGRIYAKNGGRVVLKNHLGCTAAQAWEVRQQGFPVYGSVVLNEIAGGIDYRVVERSLCQNGDSDLRLIVHMPTITGRPHKSTLNRTSSHSILNLNPIKPLTVSNESGQLSSNALDVLRMARDQPIVVSTGHANEAEVRLLVDAAIRLNVRLMLNQPANPMTGLSAEALIEIAKEPNIYVEQTSLTYLLGYQSKEDYYEVLRNVPNVIYSSDLGQTSQPDIEKWLEMSANWIRECNVSSQRHHDLRWGMAERMLRL
ncbi:hypothetical protein CYD30_28850 [Kosakonia cowanii]|nr:hypothetical protein CYD30_28850 [Kosakonia cowanii]